MSKPLDMTGRTFDRLTVVARAGSTPRGRALWRCCCSCGGEVVTQTSYLTTGDTRSCGCLFREATIAKGMAKKIDLAGQSFGRLTVLADDGRTRKGEVRWRCRCSCGREHMVRSSQLLTGRCLSCGCLRNELRRSRAAAVGSIRRIKACRTCGRIYEAIGPQKECSDECRRRWHTADESRRREAEKQWQAEVEAAALSAELQRRLTDGP